MGWRGSSRGRDSRPPLKRARWWRSGWTASCLCASTATPSRSSEGTRSSPSLFFEGRPLQQYLANGCASLLFTFEGEPHTTLALQGSHLCEHITGLCLVAPSNQVQVSLNDGALQIVIYAPTFLTEEANKGILRAIVGGCEALRKEMSERTSEASELIRVLRGTPTNQAVATSHFDPKLTLPLAIRWAAARELCAHHADSREVNALATHLHDEAPTTRAGCLLWGGLDGPFATSPREVFSTLVPYASRDEPHDDLIHLLTTELAWSTLMSHDLQDAVRKDAAWHALSAHDTPRSEPDRDAALLRLLHPSPHARSLDRGRILDHLVDAGWAPGPDTTLKLAKQADRAVGTRLLAFIDSLDDPTPFAATLDVLRKANVVGARELFERVVSRHAGGGLTVHEGDDVRGRLTSSQDRGSLTMRDDEHA